MATNITTRWPIFSTSRPAQFLITAVSALLAAGGYRVVNSVLLPFAKERGQRNERVKILTLQESFKNKKKHKKEQYLSRPIKLLAGKKTKSVPDPVAFYTSTSSIGPSHKLEMDRENRAFRTRRSVHRNDGLCIMSPNQSWEFSLYPNLPAILQLFYMLPQTRSSSSSSEQEERDCSSSLEETDWSSPLFRCRSFDCAWDNKLWYGE